ncbi:MAG TPA: hypothetical protein VM287_06290 [Egibacteraceae bacterium]|nr:hypothetical protein [Egibacteraceae bacterium]
MPRTGLAVGLVLLVAGAATLLASTAVGGPPTATRSGTPQAVDADVDDPLDISANNTPTLARNPTDADNLVLVHRIDQPTFGCGLHTSADGGSTWQERVIPQPPDTEPKCYAPDVAFGANGTLFVSYVMLQGLGNVPESVWLASSTDGGRTLSQPQQITGSLAFQVRLVAHPTVPDHLAIFWLQAEDTATLAFPGTGYPIVMAGTQDGGESWQEPVQVSDRARERVLAPVPAMAEGGDLSVLYLDVLDDRLNYHGGHEGQAGPTYPGPWELVLARSTDDGRSWSETTVDAELVPIDRYLVFVPPLPSLAVDGDRLYAAFHDARLGDADVWLWASDDAGASWQTPVRVNHNEPEGGTSQHLPQVDVAPDGRVDVLYYDRQADPDDVMTEVSLQSSGDGGRTFGPRFNVSGGAFAWPGPWSHGERPELGSRLALISGLRQSLAAWPDMRADTLDVGEQDIYWAAVAFEGSRLGAAGSWRVVGLLLMTAGIIMLAARAVQVPPSATSPSQSGVIHSGA